MFFLVELTRSVELHPRYFGTGLEEMVEKRLREEVEGNVEGKIDLAQNQCIILNTKKGQRYHQRHGIQSPRNHTGKSRIQVGKRKER